jgi:nicotinamide mononucleotide (NMN) deamidase PncC
MQQSDRQRLVERIHKSGRRLVLSVTGGGSGAIPALLAVPGASASVLEAIVPYAATALEQWLGGPVDNFCSERTARAMAMAAFERARRLSDVEPHSVRGIGATASLATTRPKRGPHRVHVAWQSAEATVALSCELAKGRRTRGEEEEVGAALVLAAVAEACGIPVDLAERVDPEIAAVVQRREKRAPAGWTELLLGRRNSLAIGPNGSEADASVPAILFPGAFNPLHAGHEQMAALAAEKLAAPVTFELSITNVDKPPLDFVEIAGRLEQFAARPVLLTRAATFAEKAALAPGCVFVVGIDTLARIGDERYYGGQAAQRDAAIETIARHGCRFLVFGRAIDGRFANVADVELPVALRRLCDSVPESEFHADLSSTELRHRC